MSLLDSNTARARTIRVGLGVAVLAILGHQAWTRNPAVSEQGSGTTTVLGLALKRHTGHDSNELFPTALVHLQHATTVRLKHELETDATLLKAESRRSELVEFSDAQGHLSGGRLDAVSVGRDQRSVYLTLGSPNLPDPETRRLVTKVDVGLVLGVDRDEVRVGLDGDTFEVGDSTIEIDGLTQRGDEWVLRLASSSPPPVVEYALVDGEGRAIATSTSTHTADGFWTCELTGDREPRELDLEFWSSTRTETRRVEAEIGLGL